MLGELSETQIEGLLKTCPIGRIGCHLDGITYVVPVNYVYDGSFIYAHSGEGMKINIMRKNPEVCFQVDSIKDIVNWQSVIAWGRFEELTDIHDKELAMQKLIDKIMSLVNKNGAHPSHGITANESDIGDTVDLILYRISLTRKTGRFESA
jgi:nitroimidazol reductase NimA-like FMN-containing flavoprotein (pyridoxamine 5'-phosphate oxidase superfamily)